MASATPETLWLLRLSRITMSPGCSVGHKNSRTEARNISPSIGPSVTIGAVNRRRRSAPTKVVVFQCPWGAEAMQRLPLGARPQRRVMLVDVHVSSINTSFSTSIPGNDSTHARRACCTSSRSCSLACSVFFEGETPFVHLMPQCAGLDRYALLGQSFAQFGQGKIGLGCDPGAQHGLHLSHP